MNIPALELAVAQLRGLQVRLEKEDKLNEFNMNYWLKRDECGTAACVVGWASLEKWFEPLGMVIEMRQMARETPMLPAQHKPVFTYEGKTSDNYLALNKLFGLEHRKTIELLVLPEQYTEDDVTPVVVADRIAELIRCGEREFLTQFNDDYEDEDRDQEEWA